MKKRANPEDKENLKKLELRLSKGLLILSNKNTTFRKILELFMKDQCEYLEKRR